MLSLTFGDAEVNVNTTSTLLRLLAATHRRHWTAEGRGFSKRSQRSMTVEIAPPDRAPELALRGAKREIALEVAAYLGWYALAAVVVEREGRALIITGSPGAGKSTIATHLLARGWRLISDDIAFIDERRGAVIAHQGLMMLRSGSLPFVPAAFRATLERSEWFVDDGGELQFYAIDPAVAFGGDAWSPEAVLDAVIVVDERAPSENVVPVACDDLVLVAIDGRTVPLAAFPQLRIGAIRPQGARQTADRIEHWCDPEAGA